MQLGNVRTSVSLKDIPGTSLYKHCIFSRSTVIVKAQQRSSDSPQSRVPTPPALSFFTPYKNLPPNGQLIHPHEEMCDIEVSNCKTLTYVYEDKCSCCSGTGFARGLPRGGRGRGRGAARGSLHTCVVCSGIGYVRHTTSRFKPEVQHDVHLMTLARQQKLPGEPSQQLPAAAPAPPDKWSRLRKAKDIITKITNAVHKLDAATRGDGNQAPAPASGNGNGVASSNGKAAPVMNNVVSSGALHAEPVAKVAGSEGVERKDETVKVRS